MEVKERYTLVFRRDASLDPAQECSYVTRGCVTNFRWNVRQVREREGGRGRGGRRGARKKDRKTREGVNEKERAMPGGREGGGGGLRQF